MAPRAVTVRYSYSDAGEESRSACFRGLFFDCRDEAVLRRLQEVHRFAERVEVVELLWQDPRGAPMQARQGGGP